MARFFCAAFAAVLTFGPLAAQTMPPAERVDPASAITNGLIRERIIRQGTRWEVDGREVTEAKGRGAIAGDEQIPDDSRAPSLTLIGSNEDTSKLRKEWAGAPAVAELVGKFLVQEFEPTNPLISRAGFVSEGRPCIYAEMPDGRTLFRLKDYPGDQAFIRTVQHALQLAEGVRKPQPDYQPVNDPGVVLPIKPKIDVDVSPSPWTLIVTHFAALVVGLVGGVGGVAVGGLVIRKLLAAAIAAEMAKAVPPAAPPATVQK